ncbi:MAG TPA: alpha/beta hydrolase [Kofleriaceae bacterium]|nr:alpha/beta hydrolase [Kofleriaceae bacterium]
MRWAGLLCLVAACAHTPNLPLRPDDAPPAGSTTETVTARDGTPLLARHWAPTAQQRGVVVIMHGLKDHSARYADFATRLAAAGYAVYAFDLRGHGRSAGPRVAPDPWDDYVDDLDRFLAVVESREPGKPVFLFGHSMGGAIATLAAIRHQPRLAGLVLSGPALAIDAPPILIAATRMSGTLTPKAPALKLNNRDFSSDPHGKQAMDADPLISQPPAPARTAAGLVDGMHRIWASVDRLDMPLLALHGTRDKLTAPSGSRALVRAAASKDKTLKLYDGFFHDLVHEPNGTQVEADILAWLDGHTGGTAVPPPVAVDDRHLTGDPRGWTQAVELAGGIVRGEGEMTYLGSLAVEVARPSPIGWHGDLVVRVTDLWSVALRPLGIAFRSGPRVIGLAGGGSLVSGTSFAASGSAWLEAPLGPVHVGALAEWTRTFEDRVRGPLGSDLLWTQISLRVPGDRAYWPGAHAGVGPVLTGGYLWAGDAATAFSITLGLALYGAD